MFGGKFLIDGSLINNYNGAKLTGILTTKGPFWKVSFVAIVKRCFLDSNLKIIIEQNVFIVRDSYFILKYTTFK